MGLGGGKRGSVYLPSFCTKLMGLAGPGGVSAALTHLRIEKPLPLELMLFCSSFPGCPLTILRKTECPSCPSQGFVVSQWQVSLTSTTVGLGGYLLPAERTFGNGDSDSFHDC